MAKGKTTSLVVRAVALLFAVALTALAAKLWLGPKPNDEREGVASGSGSEDAEGAVSGAPPPHADMSDEDREALRGILRDSQADPP